MDELDDLRAVGERVIEPAVIAIPPPPFPEIGVIKPALAVEASGNICVATLVTGYITVISPGGQVVRQVKMPDVYPTNICFGGRDMKTAFITLSGVGQLGVMDWPEPGLRLNFQE